MRTESTRTDGSFGHKGRKKAIKMKQIINYFTDDDLYKFTMCCAVIDNFPRAQVKYTFTDRDNTTYPAGSNTYRHGFTLISKDSVSITSGCRYIRMIMVTCM